MKLKAFDQRVFTDNISKEISNAEFPKPLFNRLSISFEFEFNHLGDLVIFHKGSGNEQRTVSVWLWNENRLQNFNNYRQKLWM